MKAALLMSISLMTLSLFFASLSEAKNKTSAKTKEAMTQTKKASEKITANQGKNLAAKKLAKNPGPKKALQKSLSFNDRVVKGKHQVPGEGLVTVENEKPVFNLLSIRSDFNDRREEERQRD